MSANNAKQNKRPFDAGESSSGSAKKTKKAPKTRIAELIEHDSRAFIKGTVKTVMSPAGQYRFSMTTLRMVDGDIKIIAYGENAEKLHSALKNAQEKEAVFRYVYTKLEAEKHVKGERMWEANINTASEIEVLEDAKNDGAKLEPDVDDKSKILTLADIVTPGTYAGMLQVQLLDKLIAAPLPMRPAFARFGSVVTDGMHKAEFFMHFNPPTKIAPGEELLLMRFDSIRNGKVLKITAKTVEDIAILPIHERNIQSEQDEDEFDFPPANDGSKPDDMKAIGGSKPGDEEAIDGSKPGDEKAIDGSKPGDENALDGSKLSDEKATDDAQ